LIYTLTGISADRNSEMRRLFNATVDGGAALGLG
jgi:hypothetical protein